MSFRFSSRRLLSDQVGELLSKLYQEKPDCKVRPHFLLRIHRSLHHFKFVEPAGCDLREIESLNSQLIARLPSGSYRASFRGRSYRLHARKVFQKPTAHVAVASIRIDFCMARGEGAHLGAVTLNEGSFFVVFFCSFAPPQLKKQAEPSVLWSGKKFSRLRISHRVSALMIARERLGNDRNGSFVRETDCSLTSRRGAHTHTHTHTYRGGKLRRFRV